MMRKVALLSALMLATVALADRFTHRRDFTIPWTAAPYSVAIPRFDPLMGSLYRVTIRVSVRMNSREKVSNPNLDPRVARGIFRTNYIGTVALGDYHIFNTDMLSNFRGLTLHRNDGVPGGADEFNRDVSPSSQTFYSSTEMMSTLLGGGDIQLQFFGGHNFEWYWRTVGDPTGLTPPVFSFNSTATVSIVVVYEFAR